MTKAFVKMTISLPPYNPPGNRGDEHGAFHYRNPVDEHGLCDFSPPRFPGGIKGGENDFHVAWCSLLHEYSHAEPVLDLIGDGNPDASFLYYCRDWIPAFAGMTK